MRAFLSLVAILLLAGCTFVLDVNGSTYRVSVRPAQQVTALPTPDQPTPTQEKGLCLVKLEWFAINERTEPSTTAPKTSGSPIPAGSIVAVQEFLPREGYLWAQNAFGWFVVRDADDWWVTFLVDTLEWCLRLPGYPPGVEPPETIAAERSEFIG